MRKALDARTGKNRRQRIRHAQHDSDDDSEDVEMDEVDPPEARGKDRNSPIVVNDMDITDDVVETKLERTTAQPATSITFGGALRRNDDKSVAIPVMVKRQPKPSKITRRVSHSPFNSSARTTNPAHRRLFDYGNRPNCKRRGRKTHPILIVPTLQMTPNHERATPTKGRAKGTRKGTRREAFQTSR